MTKDLICNIVKDNFNENFLIEYIYELSETIIGQSNIINQISGNDNWLKEIENNEKEMKKLFNNEVYNTWIRNEIMKVYADDGLKFIDFCVAFRIGQLNERLKKEVSK